MSIIRFIRQNCGFCLSKLFNNNNPLINNVCLKEKYRVKRTLIYLYFRVPM